MMTKRKILVRARRREPEEPHEAQSLGDEHIEALVMGSTSRIEYLVPAPGTSYVIAHRTLCFARSLLSGAPTSVLPRKISVLYNG